MEEAFGEATLEWNRPTFELRHFRGDEDTFECGRRR